MTLILWKSSLHFLSFMIFLEYHHVINHGRISFLNLDNAVYTAAKKKLFPLFFDTKMGFAVKIAYPMRKQLTSLKICDQDGFFERSSYSNYDARLFTTLWPPNQSEHWARLLYTPICSAHLTHTTYSTPKLIANSILHWKQFCTTSDILHTIQRTILQTW